REPPYRAGARWPRAPVPAVQAAGPAADDAGGGAAAGYGCTARYRPGQSARVGLRTGHTQLRRLGDPFSVETTDCLHSVIKPIGVRRRPPALSVCGRFTDCLGPRELPRGGRVPRRDDAAGP